MSAIPWLCVAAAVFVAPPLRRPRPCDARTVRSALTPRTLGLLASAGIAVCCVALLGGSRGVIGALVLAGPAFEVARRLAIRAVPKVTGAGLPLVLDLSAAALRSGQPLESVLMLVASAAPPRLGEELLRVSRLLYLGAEPVEAWRSAAALAPLRSVASVAIRSARSGARLADACEQLAAELRADLRAAAEAKAHRAGVWAVAPLGLCFLPAFVCLGIVPTVAGIATEILG